MPEPTNPITEHGARMAAVPDEAADIASKLVEQIVSGHLDAAHEYVENDHGAVEDYSPHPASIESDARAVVAAVTPVLTAKSNARVRVLEGQLATARSLHRPEPDGLGYREQPYPDSNGAYGRVDPACPTCGQHDEYAVKWPCDTARALGLDGGGSDA